MNNIMLSGRLATEIVMKKTSNNKPYGFFNFAVRKNYMNSNGERTTDFFKCVVWGKMAVIMNETLEKGEKIIIEGNLSNRIFTDKENVKRYINEVIVERFEYTVSKKQKNNQNVIINEVNEQEYEDVFYLEDDLICGMSEEEYREWIQSDF